MMHRAQTELKSSEQENSSLKSKVETLEKNFDAAAAGATLQGACFPLCISLHHATVTHDISDVGLGCQMVVFWYSPLHSSTDHI